MNPALFGSIIVDLIAVAKTPEGQKLIKDLIALAASFHTPNPMPPAPKAEAPDNIVYTKTTEEE